MPIFPAPDIQLSGLYRRYSMLSLAALSASNEEFWPDSSSSSSYSSSRALDYPSLLPASLSGRLRPLAAAAARASAASASVCPRSDASPRNRHLLLLSRPPSPSHLPSSCRRSPGSSEWSPNCVSPVSDERPAVALEGARPARVLFWSTGEPVFSGREPAGLDRLCKLHRGERAPRGQKQATLTDTPSPASSCARASRRPRLSLCRPRRRRRLVRPAQDHLPVCLQPRRSWSEYVRVD
jgi:hypothetical protein